MKDLERSSQNCRIGKCGVIGEESGYMSQNPKYYKLSKDSSGDAIKEEK